MAVQRPVLRGVGLIAVAVQTGAAAIGSSERAVICGDAGDRQRFRRRIIAKALQVIGQRFGDRTCPRAPVRPRIDVYLAVKRRATTTCCQKCAQRQR